MKKIGYPVTDEWTRTNGQEALDMKIMKADAKDGDEDLLADACYNWVQAV